MNKIKPEISVVLPVYNVECYLDECIQSILNQSFENFELLIINDGSTDTSLSICEKYSKLDVRIKLFCQSNKGVSRTRNIGIDIAGGEYIVFIDSDDILEASYLLSLYNIIKSNNCDVVISGYIDSQTGNKISPNFIINKVMKGEDLILSASKVHSNNDLCFAWRNIYNSHFLKKDKIKFPEKISIGEDVIFNLQAILKSERVIAVSDCLYIYRTDSMNSTMRKSYKPNLEASLVLQYEARKQISESYGLLSKEHYLQDMCEYYVYNIYRLLINNARQNSTIKFKDSLKHIISLNLIRDNIRSLNFSLKDRTLKEFIYLNCLKYRFFIPLLYFETK